MEKHQIDGRSVGGLKLSPGRVSGHDCGNEWLRGWKSRSLVEEEEFKDPRALVIRKLILLESPRMMIGVLVGMTVTRNLNIPVQGGSQVCADLQ